MEASCGCRLQESYLCVRTAQGLSKSVLPACFAVHCVSRDAGLKKATFVSGLLKVCLRLCHLSCVCALSALLYIVHHVMQLSARTQTAAASTCLNMQACEIIPCTALHDA